jgi:hypothetical protein
MRLWGWLRVIVLVVVVVPLLTAGAVAALAQAAPFLPGQAPFAVQVWAEDLWASTMPDAAAGANYRIDLAERRAANLAARAGTPWESEALAYVDKALDQAVLAAIAAPSSAAAPLQARLLALARRLEVVLQELTVVPAQNQDVYANSVAKVAALVQAASRLQAPAPAPTADVAGPAQPGPSPVAGMASPTPPPDALVQPQPVMFPPNATPGMHDTFPLSGKHASIQCAACHPAGDYLGTPKDCTACHAKDKPAAHYPGVCSQCHNTVAWKPASFDHTGAKDCTGCHTKDKPAKHFAGQCSLCHSTIAWLPAHMNHTGLTDCVACHTKDKPANHFPGQCSGCHTTTAWKPPVVNHSAFSNLDCGVCHQPPANHFPLACGLCHHDTTNWKNVQFDHSNLGGLDCGACHQPPANHLPPPCSRCHQDTTNWKNANFNHAFPLDHGGANSNCSVCHPSGLASWTCAACHANAAMDARHQQVSGYSRNCIQCHLSAGGGG